MLFKNISIAIIALGILMIISYVLAWTEPNLPPSSTSYPLTPITKSSTAQTKSGNLTVNGDVNATQLCLAGTCWSSWPW